jgi:hypothetical protein
MGWFGRLWRRRYRRVANLHEIGTGRVDIAGVVEAVDSLHNPVDGAECVAMEYRAWPPATTAAIDGATAHGSRAYQICVRQAVDFVLADRFARVLVRTRGSVDIEAIHEDLLARHGVGLRTELETIEEGTRVRVLGRVCGSRATTGSPHRAEPYVATVDADRFWLA